MNKVLFYLFFLIVFFSNLTTWQIYGDITGFNVFMVLFVVFVAFTLLNFTKYYGLAQNKSIYIPLLIFFGWWFFRSLLSYSNPLFYNTELWQWILLFILFTNYISQDIRTGYVALFAYVLSAMIIVIIYYFGNNVLYESGRLTVFKDSNPNTIGSITSNALLIIVFLVLKNVLEWGKFRFLLLLAIPGLFVTMIETGSRGSLVYLSFGLICYLIFSKIKFLLKISVAFVLLFVSSLAYLYLSTSEIFQNRWIYADIWQLGGRSYLWLSSFKLFLEKPIIGYGDGGFWTLIHKDPHNLYLVLLVTSGVIGFFLFSIFLYRIFNLVILNIRLAQNIICFVLFTISLVAFFKEGSALNSISTWIRLSIIAGLSTSINNINSNNNNDND